jgi:hypothetical protein
MDVLMQREAFGDWRMAHHVDIWASPTWMAEGPTKGERSAD